MSFDPGSARLTQTVRPSSWGRYLILATFHTDHMVAYSLCIVNGAEKLAPETRGTLYLSVVEFLTYPISSISHDKKADIPKPSS
jgi:hypothetical protein